MTSKTFASRGARAVIVILAAIALVGEASATSWKAIPVRDAVSKADAIVRGKVAAVEPLDVNSDVVVVEVAAVLKGDMPKDATIRLVAAHGGAKGVHRFREGEEGIWLATKLPDREAYAVSGHPVSFQTVAAARAIELLVAGTTDAGAEMPELLREADARGRLFLLGPTRRRAQAQAMREARASNAKHMQPAALRHEQAMAGVKTLRAWWAQAAAAGP